MSLLLALSGRHDRHFRFWHKADIQQSPDNVRFWEFVPQLNFINGIGCQTEPNRAIEIKNVFDCTSNPANSGRLFDPPRSNPRVQGRSVT
jgi:hypothetical protein